MKKFKLFLSLLMLFSICVGQVWADKITSIANIESGKAYYIGATKSNSTDYYLSVADHGDAVATGKAGSAVASKDDADVFTFTKSGDNWTIQFASGKYLTLASSKANGKVNVAADAAAWTITESGSLLNLKINNYCLMCNSQTNTANFGSYASGQLNVWLELASTPDPEYTIEAASNNTNYGTVSLSGSVITASPASGYTYANPAYTVSPANSATVAQNGNAFTVTPSANTTVTINFEAIPTYTVTLKDNNATLTQETGGAAVTLPSRENCTSKGYTFAGWTKSWNAAVNEATTTAPTIIPAGSYTPEGDENLYPVYTKSEGGDPVDVTIQASNFTNLGSNNYGSGAERTGTVGTISLGGHYITGSSTNIQCQASNANIYNKTAFPGKITKVELNQTGTVAFSLYVGTEQLMASNNTSTGQTPSGTKITDVTGANKMTWDVTGDYTYFDIKKGGSAGYISSIVVTYSSATTYYLSDPNCCTELETINGTVTKTHNSVTIIWDNVTGSSNWAVKLNNVSVGEITSINEGAQKKCVISNLESTTEYTFVVSADVTGYCSNKYEENFVVTTDAALQITAQTNNESYGTVSLSGLVITGAPKAYCQYAETAYEVVSGTATVSQNGNAFTVTPTTNCTIKINFQPIPVTSVTLSDDALALETGGNATLTATVEPQGVANPAVTWESSNTSVATVENGVVTAVAAGTATITCKSVVDNTKKAECSVTVTDPLPTIMITGDDLTDFAASYADYAWSKGGASGIVGAYKNGGMQFNPSKAGYYAYNTTAIPGNIRQIAMTKASGSNRTWSAYVSDAPMTAADENKLLEAKEVASTTTWNVTGSNSYFYLQVADGATVISSIVITYEPILSEVTVATGLANGSVDVTGAADLTKVAAGTELTLSNTPASGYQLAAYDVYKTGDSETKVTVSNGKFIMPTYAVTVSASFEEEKNLESIAITNPASKLTFWVNETFSAEGVAIKAVYDNTTEKENVTPKSITAPDMSEAGQKTVTIAYEEKGIEKTTSYEITVKALPTTAKTAATVAEIREIYDLFGDTEGLYVKGTIYKISGFYSNKYITYWITDSYDAEAETEADNHTNEFELYNGLDLGGADFKAVTDLEKGQEVVVMGDLTQFGSNAPYTYEFSTGNQIISRPKYVKSIALSEGYKTAFNDNEEFSHEGVTVTATYNYGDDETVNATWSEPVMTQLGEQEVTVSYTYEGKTVEFKYNITITHVCAQENLVAVTKGEEVNGAYSLSAEEVCTEGDGATVDVTDIVPAEGYRFKEITATNGTVDNENKQVTGITAATTITVVFEPIPSYTVTWNVNGETTETSVQEGSKPVFPATPESCDATSTTFIGWATAAWEGKAANLDNKIVYVSNATMDAVTANGTIYYAVFAKATAGATATEFSHTIEASDFNNTSYAANNNEKTRTAVCTSDNTKEVEVKWTSNQVMLNGSNMQGKKSEGYIYNAASWGKIKSITINDNANYSYVIGEEAQPTVTAEGGFFKISAGSSTSTATSIVIVFEQSEESVVYEDYMTTCCPKKAITIDTEIANGTVTADKAEACEGDKVTLTPTANPAYHFNTWAVSYNDGESDHEVTVNSEVVNEVTVYSFTMPAYAVTVSATFEHDPCQGLEKPALDGEIVVDYQSAIIAWNEVENASSYVLNITEGETPVVENASITDLTDLSYLVENLTAKTTYNFSIMAVGDGTDYCATNTALEGNFTTIELPAATLTLSENGEEYTYESLEPDTLYDVVTLPSTLHFSGCTGKVLKGWSKVAVAEQDEEPTENYYAAGTQYTIGATADKLYAVFATEGAGQASKLFSETFDACTNTGGNDNQWSNSIANGTLSLEGWTVVSGNAASGCAKFGASKAAGSAETPAIEITGAATLTFRAGAWSGDNTTLKISASGATLDQSSVTIASAAWNSYTVAISEATGSVKIKFESNVTNKGRFFLDDVVVSQSAISYSDYTTSCAAALDVPTFSLNPVVTPVEDEYQEAIHVVIATAVEGATIYYTTNGNNPTTASAVYSEPITLNTCGEHTIKAFVKKDAQESAIATATYTLAIPVPASDVTPFTPQQAIDVYNSGCYNNEQVHVKGVVTSASFNETLQNAAAAYNGSYNVFVKTIGDNNENPVTYEFYRMWKDNNNTAFTKGDIKAGDTITATGTMTKYQTTYEFNAGCYMESYVAYDEPKTDISNTVDNPYTVEVADGLIDNINSDLTKTVFVKGIVTSFPSSNKVIIRDTENGEEYLELYKSTLADGISALVIGDQIIVTGIMQKYNNQTYQMNEGCEVVWKKAKVVIEIAAMNMVVNDVATITPTSVTPEAAAEAITYSIKEGSEEYITLNGAQITATAAGTATIIATVETAETYIGTSVEFTVTVAAQADTRKTAQDLDGFDATSGDLNTEISYEGKKGTGTSAAAIPSGKNFIRIYQGGGYLAIDAAKGCIIDEVIITTAADGNNTTVAVGTDEANLPTTGGVAVNKGTTFTTGTNMNSQHVYLVNLGTTGSNRLEIATIVVKYTGDAKAVDHYTLAGEYATEFPKNGTFSSEGLVVYACYANDESDNVNITAQCTVEADLSTMGDAEAIVKWNGVDIKHYAITVIAGKEDPALVYKRGEEVVTSEVIEAANVASWIAPTLSMAFEVSPINYQTNNNSVLTVNGEGEIAWAGGYGTAKITASFAGDDDYIASVATYTLTINEPANKIAGEWHKVTSIADLAIGSKVIVANIAEGTDVKTMGAVSDNGKYRLEVASTVNNDGILSAEDGTKTFTLVDAGNGLYAFKGNNGKYLSAASSSSNDMKEVTMIDANASWSISIEEGVATILAQGSYSRNWLRYNQQNTRFSCYGDGQLDIALYVNRKEYVAPAVDPENPTPATPVAINTNVEEEEIVASGNVVVTVNTDNFEEPKSYIAQNGATIVINGNGAEEAKSVIADEQSTIQVNQPTTVNQVFSVAATMGAGVSGQITGASNVTIAESTEAYFDITLGANATSSQWHAIAVPFPVDALNGIYDAVTGAKLTNEVNYAIMDYHGDIRATGAYGWKKYRGILQSGVFYLMTVDGDTKTFRFKMSGTTLPTATSLALQLFAQTSGDNKDGGWNGVANPTLQHGTVNQTVTVLNPNTYTYEDKDAGEMNFVVGTPFFIQATADAVATGMTMGAADPTKPYYAPKRDSENGIEKVRVLFGNDKYQDKLTISANEGALNEYEIGKDLIKMTMTKTPKVAQIFGNAYGTKLCRANLPLVNDAVSMEIDLYAPETGEYAISTAENANATVYLTLNGNIIWNLSMSEYTSSFEKGNNAGYGIRIVKAPQVGTDIDNIYENASGVQKVVIDEHVYILRGEQMFDVTGKSVK